MQRMILLHATKDHPEMAIVRVSGKEHHTLHKPGSGLKLVNRSNIFTKPAKALKMRAGDEELDGTGCLVLMAHPPSCTVTGSCVAA